VTSLVRLEVFVNADGQELVRDAVTNEDLTTPQTMLAYITRTDRMMRQLWFALPRTASTRTLVREIERRNKVFRVRRKQVVDDLKARDPR
jgi:hypothetical protein